MQVLERSNLVFQNIPILGAENFISLHIHLPGCESVCQKRLKKVWNAEKMCFSMH